MKKKLLLFSLFTINILMAQVPSYVPTIGLVGYWPFNSNANDVSGNGNNGTVNGATLTTDRNGVANSSYNYNGNQQNIVIQNSNSINTNAITINIWALPLQDNITLIAKSNPTNATEAGFSVTHNDFWQIQRGLKSKFGNGACNNTSAPDVWGNYNQVGNNVWSMITVSIDINGNVKQYINGILNYTEIITPLISCNSSSSTLRIGGQHWNSDTEWFNGKLDDIGIWNRALTQSEITGLYNTLSNSQTEAVNQIAIYPNPAKDQITIDCGNISSVSGWRYTIVNTLGQEVSNGIMNSQQNVVSFNTLNGTGVYLVKIYDAESNLISTNKIIKE